MCLHGKARSETHFGLNFTSFKMTEVKFSNQFEISCKHIFTRIEPLTRSETKNSTNLIG